MRFFHSHPEGAPTKDRAHDAVWGWSCKAILPAGGPERRGRVSMLQRRASCADLRAPMVTVPETTRPRLNQRNDERVGQPAGRLALRLRPFTTRQKSRPNRHSLH